MRRPAEEIHCNRGLLDGAALNARLLADGSARDTLWLPPSWPAARGTTRLCTAHGVDAPQDEGTVHPWPAWVDAFGCIKRSWHATNGRVRDRLKMPQDTNDEAVVYIVDDDSSVRLA
jgi:hypothetical protein